MASDDYEGVKRDAIGRLTTILRECERGHAFLAVLALAPPLVGFGLFLAGALVGRESHVILGGLLFAVSLLSVADLFGLWAHRRRSREYVRRLAAAGPEETQRLAGQFAREVLDELGRGR